MVTYLRGLPRELAEAARIDGASSFAILTRIVIPLAWPGIVVSGIVVSGIVVSGIVVSGIFAFLLGWNDVLLASVMTRPDTQTAAVALQVFGATQEGGEIPIYGQMMAAAMTSVSTYWGGGRSGVPVPHRPARWGPTWPRGTRRRATPAGPRRTDRGPSAASDPRERAPRDNPA